MSLKKEGKLKVVHELNQLEFGGAERVVLNIVKFDEVNQHTIVSYKDGPFREEFEKVGVEVIVLSDDKELDIATDLINIHSGGGISRMAMEAGKEFPVIETIHSPLKTPMPDDYIVQRIGVSDVVTGLNNNCITIYNGLDFDTLQPTKTPEEVRAELGIAPDQVVIGRLGRLGTDKGVEDYLLACYCLQQEGFDFVPLIVGSEALHSSGYVGKCKLMAASLPLENCIWTGHRTDRANLLQVMDIFLYPSATEGFGYAFIEAMYLGANVVTYNTPVNKEIVKEYGWLADKNIDGLVEGLAKVYSEPRGFFNNAREYVKENFSAKKMSEKYQEVYQNVINRCVVRKD